MSMSQVEVLRAACCVAGLDKQITDAEREWIDKLAEIAGVGEASLNAMLQRATEDHGFYQEQFRHLSAEADSSIKMLFLVAMADHDLSLNERVVLQHFADVLGMTQERFDQIYRSAEKQIAEKRQDGAGPA